jgi:hypothetical protein
MKEIIIDGRKWWYERTADTSMTFEKTHFFSEVRIETTKEYLFFGKKIERIDPVLDYDKYFTINLDIEDPKYDKETVRNAVNEGLKIFKRKKEIENGEII